MIIFFCISLRLFAGMGLKNTAQLGQDGPTIIIIIIIIHLIFPNWCHRLTVHHRQEILQQDT